MRIRRVAGRLDQPRPSRRSALTRRPYEPDAFGRIAERVARFIGTARFLVVQSVVVVLWIGYNIVMPPGLRFDNYPFIFLTLALSLQAAYAAPLILLAQNRQDDRDRANLAQDREQTGRQRDDTEYLAREMAALRTKVGELATRDYLRSELRAELRALLAEPVGTGEEVNGGQRRRRGSPERRSENRNAADRRA
ncbi:DUF1003 domain-containing protein [Frankia sp. Cppng1_Ct_nod]|uniref:DUF1003 domain-containing protein n=1 Tax=Frankia sp. Cppng1_Ct_nod TaxID=2897162 RepID=UPI0015849335|nr:DUF1003 domain-containing protein [Frankia sp. Cppng1_Ct_nod]